MRLPAVKRDDLSPENQQRWDRIMAGRTSGGGGPYSALIQAPLLADLLAAAENYYRKDAALAEADRELSHPGRLPANLKPITRGPGTR